MISKLNKLNRMLKRTTGLKLSNLAVLYFQKFFQKGDLSLGKPMTLLFDPSSICNLHCPLCPTGQGRVERERATASFKDYKKVIDDLKKYLFFLHITNWGEPLVNPELSKMISYANKMNIDTILYTNLTLLKPNTAEELIRSGINEIIVSLDGATEETYLKYRVGGNFKKVLNNLKLLVELKKKFKSKVVIKWQFIVSSQNEGELDQAKKMAKSLGVVFYPTPLRIDMGLEASKNRKQQIMKDRKWFPKTNKYQWYSLSRFTNKNRIRNCHWLWMKTVVNANGSVSPCCSIWEESKDFGNAYTDGILSVWNNDNYQTARRIIRTKRPNKNNVCSNCLKNGFLI